MSRHCNRGAILFELFISLMVLSIAITGYLRIFGQAVFTNQKNYHQSEAKSLIQHLLFEWFAHPKSILISEQGTVTQPLTSRDGMHKYWSTIKSERLKVKTADKNNNEQGEEVEEQEKRNEYLKVYFRVDRESGVRLLDMDTVVVKINKKTSL